MIEEKVYFMPGDLVTLKQDVPYKPIMLVVKKETYIYKKEDQSLKGIRCRWFTKDGALQEEVFNTKDLIKL